MNFDPDKDSELLKALSNPIRLKMVANLIIKDGCNVSIMVNKLGISQSNASQHLSILRKAGILSVRKKGTITCFSVSNKRVVNIIKALQQ